MLILRNRRYCLFMSGLIFAFNHLVFADPSDTDMESNVLSRFEIQGTDSNSEGEQLDSGSSPSSSTDVETNGSNRLKIMGTDSDNEGERIEQQDMAGSEKIKDNPNDNREMFIEEAKKVEPTPEIQLRSTQILLPNKTIEEIESSAVLMPRIAVGGSYYDHNDIRFTPEEHFLPFVEFGLTASNLMGSPFFIDVYGSTSYQGHERWNNEKLGTPEDITTRYRDSAVTVGYSFDDNFDLLPAFCKTGEKVSPFVGYRRGKTELSQQTDEGTPGAYYETIEEVELTVKGPFFGVGYGCYLSKHSVIGFNVAWQGFLKSSYVYEKIIQGQKIPEESMRRELATDDPGNDSSSFRFGLSYSGEFPIISKSTSYAIMVDWYRFSFDSTAQNKEFNIEENRLSVSFSLSYRFDL